VPSGGANSTADTAAERGADQTPERATGKLLAGEAEAAAGLPVSQRSNPCRRARRTLAARRSTNQALASEVASSSSIDSKHSPQAAGSSNGAGRAPSKAEQDVDGNVGSSKHVQQAAEATAAGLKDSNRSDDSGAADQGSTAVHATGCDDAADSPAGSAGTAHSISAPTCTLPLEQEMLLVQQVEGAIQQCNSSLQSTLGKMQAKASAADAAVNGSGDSSADRRAPLIVQALPDVKAAAKSWSSGELMRRPAAA
jgi:hypothetical protein